MNWDLPPSVESFLVTLVLFAIIVAFAALCYGVYFVMTAWLGPEGAGWAAAIGAIFGFTWFAVWLEW